MKLEDLLKQDGTSVFTNDVMQAALAKSRASKVEQLCEQCVGLLETTERSVNVIVSAIRGLRKQEKQYKSRIEKIERAKAFMQETGNPVPLIELTQGLGHVGVFCRNLGLDVPDSTDVPTDFVPKAE